MRCLTMDYVHTGWNIAAFFFPVPVGCMLYKGAFPLFHPESRRTYLKIHDWAVQALCSLLSARVTVCVFCLESLSRNGLTTCFLSVWLISIPLFHEISWKNDQEWLPYFPTWSNLPENLCHEATQRKPQLNHNDTTSFVTTMVLSGKPSTPWPCNPKTHLTKQKSPQLFCANLGQIICLQISSFCL